MPQLTPTTNSDLPFSVDHFDCLIDGLNYAAQGETGCNFYSGRGELVESLTYRALREDAIELALRLVRFGLPRGARVAIVAETNPDFFRFFFGCQYAGLLPVPMPRPTTLGGRDAHISRLHMMMKSSGAVIGIASEELLGDVVAAAEGLSSIKMVGSPADFYALPSEGGELRPLGHGDMCYIQYSSGSTRFPRGIMISQRSIVSNCRSIAVHGLKITPQDRGVSWLPLYHDMGLVGFAITPMMAQMSVDYISTSDFARRPLLWLKILSENKGTLSFAPTFGYDLCARRASNGGGDDYDLSNWRAAGIGAEMIRADILDRFAEKFFGSNFDPKAFLPSYGLAESTLAVSFGELGAGYQLDRIDRTQYSTTGRAVPPKGNGNAPPSSVREFVHCGLPMPGHSLEIRDADGNILGEREIGRVLIKGPSVMAGYFTDRETTERVLLGDGWLETGDLGYLVDDSLLITGRAKDLIIFNGRNIWPQDIEWAVDRLEGVRRGDVAAFSLSSPGEGESVVVVVQCRISDAERRERLQTEIRATVRRTVGVDCEVVLAPSRSLPLTSSGKLSRTWTRENYLSGKYSNDEQADDDGDNAAPNS